MKLSVPVGKVKVHLLTLVGEHRHLQLMPNYLYKFSWYHEISFFHYSFGYFSVLTYKCMFSTIIEEICCKFAKKHI